MKDILEIYLKDGITFKKGTSNSVCYDLYSNENIRIEPGVTKIIGTGVKIKFPEGRYGRVYARSSLSKIGLILSNGVGIIDNDYRGEINLALTNVSKFGVNINNNMKLCQIELCKYEDPTLKIIKGTEKYDNLETDTERGEGGFGSTDKKL